jgi:DNA-binding PadR family transcriptional regulator
MGESARDGRGNGGGHARPAVEPGDMLPLTEPVFHILLSLSDSERHGYGIILDVEEATSGQVRLRTGTLYTAMRRLQREGLIEEIDATPEPGSDGRRRVYRLTAWGRRIARAESRRVAGLAALARRRGLLARTARRRS